MTSTPPLDAPTGTTPRAPARHRTVQVPVWLLGAVLGVVVVLGAFALGRQTAPSSDAAPATLADAVELTASGEMPVGEFDARALLVALSRNEDLGLLGQVLEELGRR